jgi:hypothetical protein
VAMRRRPYRIWMTYDRARRRVTFAVVSLFLVASAVWGLFAVVNRYFDSRSQTLRPKVVTDRTSTHAARELGSSNGTQADKIQQWLTPMGSLYFGDHPPPGSTLVEPTENLGMSGSGAIAASPAETHKDATRNSKQPEEKPKPYDRVPDRDNNGKIKHNP